MMKKFKKIIGLAIAFAFMSNFYAPASFALTEPEQACADKKPDYTALMKLWSDAKMKDQNAYVEAYEEARDHYHDYIGCLFHFAEAKILKSDGAQHSGTMAANLLNTGGIPLFSSAIDWMKPDQACLTPEELKKVIQGSDPSAMLGPILQAHADYSKHLQRLGGEFDGEGILTDDDGKPLARLDAIFAKSANVGTLKRQRRLEVDNALLAIDLMFTTLKELRLAFVMHVHFQCALQNLEKYRKALEELRKVIQPLPAQLEDASIS